MPSVTRIFDYAQRYAAAIDWGDLRAAERLLVETNASVPPEAADENGRDCGLPSQ